MSRFHGIFRAFTAIALVTMFTTLRNRLVKIGAKVVGYARYAVFQMAEVAVPRELFLCILGRIGELRPRPPVRC